MHVDNLHPEIFHAKRWVFRPLCDKIMRTGDIESLCHKNGHVLLFQVYTLKVRVNPNPRWQTDSVVILISLICVM